MNFDERLALLLPNPTKAQPIGEDGLVTGMLNTPSGPGVLLTGDGGAMMAIGDLYTLSSLSVAFDCFRVLSAVRDQMAEVVNAQNRGDAVAAQKALQSLFLKGFPVIESAISAIPNPPPSVPNDGTVH